jgi:PAS domain-containing protein
VDRHFVAIARAAAAPGRSASAHRAAVAVGGWDDSAGALGVLTEGYTSESATQQLFAALSTRPAIESGQRAVAQVDRAEDMSPSMAAALDRLNVAVCAFDADDRTAFWNDTYLRFFPEHVGFIHEGEPYRANLRRFYKVRLEAEELGLLERYVDEGIARPSNEQAPQAFSHRGFWLQAAEETGPAGRVCLWTRAIGVVPAAANDEIEGPGMIGLASGLDLFEHVGEGIMLTGPHGRIGWVNEPFVAMYRLPDKARAMQGDFIDVYLSAWRGADPAERGRFEAGLTVLEENLALAGAPFELPLPGERWVRVVEQRRPDGIGCFAHVDISLLKQRQQRLLRAEERARESATRLAARSALVDAVLDGMASAVVLVDAQGSVVGCNARALELLGVSEELIATRPALDDLRALRWMRHADCVQAVRVDGGAVLYSFAEVAMP